MMHIIWNHLYFSKQTFGLKPESFNLNLFWADILSPLRLVDCFPSLGSNSTFLWVIELGAQVSRRPSLFFFFLSFFSPRLPSTMGFLSEVYEVTSSWLYGGIRGELTPGEVASLWRLNGSSDPWKSMLCYTELILDKWLQKHLRFHCFLLPYWVHYLLLLKHGGT